MIKFTGLQIALLVLVISLIVYLIFTRNKNQYKKEEKKEGKFEKFLRTMKNTEYILPSRYEEVNNNQKRMEERILGFPKQESNDIANEWIQKFVQDYCGKTTDFKFPTKFDDKYRRTTNEGQFFTIFNSNKSEEQKKDDLGMLFIIIGMLETNVKYKVIDDNTVELKDDMAAALNTEKTISFNKFKDSIYYMFNIIHMNNEEGKREYIVWRKRFENFNKSKDPTYNESTDQEIDDMYTREYNRYKNSAKVYCQNI